MLALVLHIRTHSEAKMPNYIPALDASDSKGYLSDAFVHQQPVRLVHKGPVLLTDGGVTCEHSHVNIHKCEVSSADADVLQSVCL